jgi:DNA repair exonuclease SbcCD ATPase subunit
MNDKLQQIKDYLFRSTRIANEKELSYEKELIDTIEHQKQEIEILEKENENLKCFIKENTCSIDDFKSVSKQLQQVQKENEELRKQLSMLCPIADLPVIDTLLVEKQAYMEHISKLNNLLKRLYEAAAKLDAEYCTYLNRGEHNLSVDDYEKIVDVFIEVEEYLKEIE